MAERLIAFIGTDRSNGPGEILVRYTQPIDLRYWTHPTIEIDGSCLDADMTLFFELGADHNMLASRVVHTIVLAEHTRLPVLLKIDGKLLLKEYLVLPYMRIRVDTSSGLHNATVSIISDRDIKCVF